MAREHVDLNNEFFDRECMIGLESIWNEDRLASNEAVRKIAKIEIPRSGPNSVSDIGSILLTGAEWWSIFFLHIFCKSFEEFNAIG